MMNTKRIIGFLFILILFSACGKDVEKGIYEDADIIGVWHNSANYYNAVTILFNADGTYYYESIYVGPTMFTGTSVGERGSFMYDGKVVDMTPSEYRYLMRDGVWPEWRSVIDEEGKRNGPTANRRYTIETKISGLLICSSEVTYFDSRKLGPDDTWLFSHTNPTLKEEDIIGVWEMKEAQWTVRYVFRADHTASWYVASEYDGVLYCQKYNWEWSLSQGALMITNAPVEYFSSNVNEETLESDTWEESSMGVETKQFRLSFYNGQMYSGWDSSGVFTRID